MSPEKRWYSILEAAKYFQLAPKTIYSLIGRGRLPEGSVLRLGRQIRLNVAAIEAGASAGRLKGQRG